MKPDLPSLVADLRSHNEGARGVKSRADGERAALDLLNSRAGAMTVGDAREFAAAASRSFWDGAESATRFGLAFHGGAWALATADMDRFNRFTEQMWKDSEADALGAFDAVLRDRASVPGVGTSYPSMLLYLRDPKKYLVLTTALAGGLAQITGKKYRSRNIEDYLTYCADAQKLRVDLALEPQELDLLLWGAGRSSGGDTSPDPVAELVRLVRQTYPGWTGFDDPRFVRDERTYKDNAGTLAASLLGKEELQRLIAKGDFDEVRDRVIKGGSATNLLFLSIPVEGDLAIVHRNGLDRTAFAHALLDLLHGEGTSPERLGRFADYSAARGLPMKWSFPTYLLMLLSPSTDIFVKPEATKWAIGQLGADFAIGTRPSEDLYAQVLGTVGAVFEALREFHPRDLIDIQGFIWVAHRAWLASRAQSLAAPFNRIFSSWDEAWWAFDLTLHALKSAGWTGLEDPRFAMTLYKSKSTMHVDMGQWVLLGFGDERQGANRITFLLDRSSDLAATLGGTGFAANDALTLGVQPTAAFRAASDGMTAALEHAIGSAADYISRIHVSGFRKHNRPELMNALLDEEARRTLLSQGLATSEDPGEDATMLGSDPYTHIAARGYHFPDWLITDYLLALATKPFVILSGISGTGKTKMAQLVAELSAPTVAARPTADAPIPDDASFLHRASRVLIEHFYVTIGRGSAGLFPLPERGTGTDVTLRIAGGRTLPGRLQSVDSTRYDGLTLRLYFKAEGREWVRNTFKMGDYIRVTPEGPDSLAMDVAHIPGDGAPLAQTGPRTAFLSVRPDWTDNRALLGYFNPLTGEYAPTELLKLMLRAQADPANRYFAILDEMNLAKVEYYFSDFLSAMEAGSEMVLHDSDEDLYIDMGDSRFPVPPRLKVPANLFFTGTVNVDETTYMFSPKVLDRANTIEFNEVDLLTYGTDALADQDGYHLLPGTTLEALLAECRLPEPPDWTQLPDQYKDRVRALHALMNEYQLHFGYRVANEMSRYLNLAAKYAGPASLDTALDLQVLQKVLPKLSGSRAKLEKPLAALVAHFEAEGLTRSADKVARMLDTVQKVGFVSFVE